MIAAQIRDAAPPTPACFSSRDAWVYYLVMCQEGSKGTGPFRNGKYRPEFQFCRDCTLEHTTAMARQGKCNPSQFRVIPIVEVKHERVN